jgi:CubicO group peptidase (beta-lactamase class C family)
MMKNTWLLGACWLLASCTSGGAPPAEVAPKADQYLQALADSGLFSGTVALARDGKVLFVKGYGFADAESRVPNTAATRFPIASITKTFTATLVLQLQKRGALAVTDPVCKFIDPCPAAWRQITIRHLLMHTAGLPNYLGVADLENRSRAPITLEEMVALFRDLPLEFAPGTRYRYSNSGYCLLGAIIEKASGRPFAAVLEEFIFKPLGMNDSGYDANAGVSPPPAGGYQPVGADNARAPVVDTSWLFAAGGIYSTVEDLLKWDRALTTDTLLPAQELAAMWSADLGEYGYGWQLLPPSPQTQNRRLVFHAGGIPGFATDLLRYPDERVTIIILANLHPVNLVDMSRALGSIMFGEPFSMPPERRAVRIDPNVYDEYVGRYEINPSVALDVTRENDKLVVQATGQPRDIAVPESEVTFYSRVSPARITFVKDASGKVGKLIIHDPQRDIPAIRKN